MTRAQLNSPRKADKFRTIVDSPSTGFLGTVNLATPSPFGGRRTPLKITVLMAFQLVVLFAFAPDWVSIALSYRTVV